MRNQHQNSVQKRDKAADKSGLAISVVVPVFNERDNVEELSNRLAEKLSDAMDWELVFVDDNSPDGTADRVRELARDNGRINLIFRHNRRGLSSAVVEGALAASHDIIVVMDGDLQHDEGVIPKLVEVVESGEADIASASRFLTMTGADGLSSDTRRSISETGISLANRLFGLKMTDPLTGFFAFRREVLLRALPHLTDLGFKILLDMIVSLRPRPKVKEIPFEFRERFAGESKLGNQVIWEFLLFLLDKTIGRVIPLSPRFYAFAIVGGIGVLVHMAVLYLGLYVLDETQAVEPELHFGVAQTAATLVALISNFSLNNMITYFDRRLKGVRFLKGLATFAIVCSLGIVGNVGVAVALKDQMAGAPIALPALGGIVVGTVWNYLVTKIIVWRS